MGYELDKDIMILPGNFQIPIAKNCNLHCHYCGFMDYNGQGLQTIDKSMNLDDIKTIEKKILDLGFKFSSIELFGGEPTINSYFTEIVEYLATRKGIFFDKLKLFTNGLNMTKKVVEVLNHFDRIDISTYPIENHTISEYREIWDSSNIAKKLIDVDVCVHGRTHFFHSTDFELPKDADIKKLFQACFQKDNCRVVTMDGIYRCGMIHHEKTEIYKYDKKILEDGFINNEDEPLKFCSSCDETKVAYLNQTNDTSAEAYLQWKRPNTKEWVSNNPKVDKRNYERGIELIKNYE